MHSRNISFIDPYSDVMISAMASQITGVSILSSTVSSNANQWNTEASRHWSFWGESICHRWIPLTKGQSRWKYFHSMTSSCRLERGSTWFWNRLDTVLFKSRQRIYRIMMTSSNGNIFRVTGPLCGEFTGHRWIPLTKASDAELWCFLWSTSE